MKRLIFSIFTFAAIVAAAPASADYECCNFECCEYGTFSLGADWLYWRTEETQLNYGAEVTGDLTPALTITSTVLRPKFEYSSGFRVLTDWTTPNKCWTFNGAFTHMPAQARNNVSDLGMSGFSFGQLFQVSFPILTAISSAMYTDLSSNWTSDINYFDLNAQRTYRVWKTLDISPYIGVRGLWICQKLKLAGTGVAPDLSAVVFTSTLRGRIAVGGVEGGFKSSWEVLPGLSLLANVGGSLAYGYFDNTGTLNVVNDSLPANISYQDKPYKSLPMFDAFIGARYLVCVQGWGFDIHAGWEQHLIYETNDYSLNGSGAITMQGLTLGAGVHF